MVILSDADETAFCPEVEFVFQTFEGGRHKEEALTKANYKLEERCTENSNLARQLENSLADSRRLTEDAREKSAYKVCQG